MFTNSSGAPGSEIADTSVSIAWSGISSSKQSITATLSTPKAAVAAGTYWLVWRSDNADSQGVIYVTTSVPDSGETFAQDLSYPSSWTTLTDRDVYLVINGTAGGAEVEVSATCQSLILTKYNATVNAEINVAATCPGLVVTQYDATVNAEVSIAAGYDELTLTQYPATVNAEISVAATLEELTLTTYGASISAGVNVAATCPSLTITQYKAAIKADTTFTAGYDELIVTAYVADVDIDVNVVGTCQALTLTAYDATVKVDTNILASFDELILTTPAATVSVAALEYTLMTEGVFIMVDLGGGVVYLKPASPKIKAAISTGHVTEI
jgi:hypothetical protein